MGIIFYTVIIISPKIYNETVWVFEVINEVSDGIIYIVFFTPLIKKYTEEKKIKKKTIPKKKTVLQSARAHSNR